MNDYFTRTKKVLDFLQLKEKKFAILRPDKHYAMNKNYFPAALKKTNPSIFPE